MHSTTTKTTKRLNNMVQNCIKCYIDSVKYGVCFELHIPYKLFFHYMMPCKSPDSSDSKALVVRGSRVRIPAEAGKFSLHHRIQTGSGAHPASYPMGTTGSFPEGKATAA